jgi:hypothetical protein
MGDVFRLTDRAPGGLGEILYTHLRRITSHAHTHDMAQTKDKHYWSQLRAALTGGSWGSSSPARNIKGKPITWTELLRKFDKHCHGYIDVSEIANRTQALALLLAGIPTDGELDGDGQSGEDSLALGTESVVVGEHTDEARIGFEALKNLESEHANSDVRL